MSNFNPLYKPAIRDQLLVAIIQGVSYVALAFALSQMDIGYFGVIMCCSGAFTVQVLTRCKLSHNKDVFVGAIITCATFIGLFTSVKYSGPVLTAIAAAMIPLLSMLFEHKLGSQKVQLTVVTLCCLAVVTLTNLLSTRLSTVNSLSLVGFFSLLGYVLTISTSRLLRTRDHMTKNDRHSALVLGLYLSSVAFCVYQLVSPESDVATLPSLNMLFVGGIAVLLGVITTGIGMLVQEKSTTRYPVYFIESRSILKVHIAALLAYVLSTVSSTESSNSLFYITINFSLYIAAIVVMNKTLIIKEIQNAKQ
jgi:hypothetical protein